jgi:hypothetical protein
MQNYNWSITEKKINNWNDYTYNNNLDSLYNIIKYTNIYNDTNNKIFIKINKKIKLILYNYQNKNIDIYKRKNLDFILNIKNFIDNISGMREIYYYNEYPFIYIIKYYAWNKRNISIQGIDKTVFKKFLTLPFTGYPKYGKFSFNIYDNIKYYSYDQFLMESPYIENQFIWVPIKNNPTESFIKFMYKVKLNDPNILLKKYYNIDYNYL